MRLHCTRVACHEWGPRDAADDAPGARATPRPGRHCAAGCSPGSPPSASSSPRSSCPSYLGAAFGVQTALLALAVALVPLGIVIPTFLWLDRFESEPTRYLVAAFLWGALVAAVVAALFNTGAIAVLEATTDPQAALQTTAVLVAPFVEEAAKGALVLLVWLLVRREFDGVTDGMVYAGHLRGGLRLHREHPVPRAGLHARAAARRSPARSSPAACSRRSPTRCSPCCSASASAWPRRAAPGCRASSRPLLGYLLAVLSHALWNLAAVSGGRGMVVVYVLIEVPIFLAFLGFVVWARRREGRLIGQFLRPYADAGWLSPAEVAMLASMPQAPRGPRLGPGQHRPPGAGGDAGLPGRRERAGPAAPPDVPLGRRRARPRARARAARGAHAPGAPSSSGCRSADPRPRRPGRRHTLALDRPDPFLTR